MLVSWTYLRDNFFDLDDEDAGYRGYQSKEGIAIMIENDEYVFEESIYVQEILDSGDGEVNEVVFHPVHSGEPIGRCPVDGNIKAKLYREESFLA